MNKFILMASAVALLGVQANAETVWQQIGRSLDNIGEAAVRKEAREEAQQEAEYQAAKAAEKAAKAQELQEAYVRQNLRNQARDEAFKQAALANPGFYHTDPLPLANQCDDVATIKVYLHDAGYPVNDEEASQVRSYLLAHGLKHVSEIL